MERLPNFGRWNEGRWEWGINLRRPVFGWEQQQWNSMIGLLNDMYLCSSERDKVIWKGSLDGKFSVKSFCIEALKLDHVVDPVWKLNWAGLAPPKVEVFVWQILKERVAVKGELLRRGLIRLSAAYCPFCQKEVETICHLFFQCHYSCLAWTDWLKDKGVAWCIPGRVTSFFHNWSTNVPREF